MLHVYLQPGSDITTVIKYSAILSDHDNFD